MVSANFGLYFVVLKVFSIMNGMVSHSFMRVIFIKIISTNCKFLAALKLPVDSDCRSRRC
jgi:hypothetical protein